MNIIYSKGIPTINGSVHPKLYPFWDELVELFKADGHYITEIPILPLPALQRFISTSDIVICSDSFIQHFCWYIGKRAFVLWGISDPELFGHKEHVNILKDRATR